MRLVAMPEAETTQLGKNPYKVFKNAVICEGYKNFANNALKKIENSREKQQQYIKYIIIKNFNRFKG